jgi:hypothetical protein
LLSGVFSSEAKILANAATREIRRGRMITGQQMQSEQKKPFCFIKNRQITKQTKTVYTKLLLTKLNRSAYNTHASKDVHSGSLAAINRIFTRFEGGIFDFMRKVTCAPK